MAFYDTQLVKDYLSMSVSDATHRIKTMTNSCIAADSICITLVVRWKLPLQIFDQLSKIRTRTHQFPMQLSNAMVL